MNIKMLTALKNAIESLDARISAVESDYVYGRLLIENALKNGKKKSNTKSKKQSGTT